LHPHGHKTSIITPLGVFSTIFAWAAGAVTACAFALTALAACAFGAAAPLASLPILHEPAILTSFFLNICPDCCVIVASC
jgi:hypothetical protein